MPPAKSTGAELVISEQRSGTQRSVSSMGALAFARQRGSLGGLDGHSPLDSVDGIVEGLLRRADVVAVKPGPLGS